jgi:cytochrome P450
MDGMLQSYSPYDPRLSDLDFRFRLLETARRECPIHRSEEHGGYWHVSTYELVASVLQDYDTFRSGEGVTVPHNPAQPLMPPIDSDPPAHRDWRRVLNPHLSPQALAQQSEEMRSIARRLVAEFAERGCGEIMGDYAEPFSAIVLSNVVLGINDEDLVRAVQRNNHAIASGMDKPEGRDAFIALREHCQRLVRERRQHPRDDDIVTSVIHATIGGRPVSEEEAINCMMIVHLGGLDTVSDAIGSICYRLAVDPSLTERVRDEQVFRRAVDEFLRLDSPVATLARTASRDVEVGGQKVRAGEQVLLSYLSANRDEAEFPHPEELDFEREYNRHVAFGLGPHRCVGSHLARLELEVAFGELLSRVDHLRLDGDDAVLWKTGISFGPKSLRVTFGLRESV